MASDFFSPALPDNFFGATEMMMSWKDRDEFGYPLDDGYSSKLVAITPATGWFACSKYEGQWFFEPLPLLMTVRRTDVAGRGGKSWFASFGVVETLGELERVDTSSQFMGYAHETEFEELGVTLKAMAIGRMEAGETMCGDPARHLPFRDVSRAD